MNIAEIYVILQHVKKIWTNNSFLLNNATALLV